MAVPDTTTFTMQDVTNEIYQDAALGRNLIGCFEDHQEAGRDSYYWGYYYNLYGNLYNLLMFRKYVHVHDTPTLDTKTVTDIKATTAWSGGENIDGLGLPIEEKGIIWKAGSAPTMGDNDGKNIYAQGVDVGENAFDAQMTGLTKDTGYYVRAYAKNSNGYGLATAVFFETSAVDVPTVTTKAVTGIQSTQATSGGTLTDDGGGTISGWGLVWGYNQNPTVGSHVGKFDANVMFTDFDHTMTGLNPDTTYYCRAFATNEEGTSYGVNREFKTT